MQGVEINDKHIEVIIRQMCRKVRVTDAGSSDLIGGALANRLDVESVNEELKARIEGRGDRPEAGGVPAGAAGHHQGRPGHRVLPVRRFLPGDHPRADRGRHQGARKTN